MKYIVVTGARGGMGRAFVQKAAEDGFTVFALDITSPDENGAAIIGIKADVTDEKSLNEACSVISQYTDTLYAVVHFAGIYILDSLVEIERENFESIYRINVLGPFLVNRTLMPLLKKESRIVMTTSELSTLKPLPYTGLYAVTKAALDRYAFSLRMELQLIGIYVSVIRPGAVKTGMIDKSTSDLDAFCSKTKFYHTNAARFRKIVDSVESRSITPDKLADKVIKIVKSRKPRFAYSINRNFLLSLTRFCPGRLELYAVKKILS